MKSLLKNVDSEHKWLGRLEWSCSQHAGEEFVGLVVKLYIFDPNRLRFIWDPMESRFVVVGPVLVSTEWINCKINRTKMTHF